MAALAHRVEGPAHVLAVVAPALLGVIAHTREFLDIRPRGERLRARAAQDDAPQRVLRGQRAHHPRELLPHRERDRVELAGVGERNRGDRAVALDEYLGFCLTHHSKLHQSPSPSYEGGRAILQCTPWPTSRRSSAK